MRRILSVVVVIAVLFLLACGKKAEKKRSNEEIDAEQKTALAPLVEKHRAAANKGLAMLLTIGKDAIAAPRVTEPSPLPPGTILDKKLTAFGPAWWFADATKLSSYDSSDPKYRDQPFHTPGIDVEAVRELLDAGIWVSGVEHSARQDELVADAFESALSFKYAVVSRAHTYTAPSVGSGGFVGGKIAGDAAVYSLEDGKRLGAFPFEIVQTLKELSTSKGTQGAETELAKEFRDEIDAKLRSEAQAFAKGNAGGAAPGVAVKAEIADIKSSLQTDIMLWSAKYTVAVINEVELEPGPTVVIKTDRASTYEEHRAELEKLVEDKLGGKATIRIEKVARPQ